MKSTDVIKPVSLGCTSSNNVDAVAIGNGLMHTGDKDLAPILQYAPLKTISLLRCVIFYPIVAFRKSIICSKGEQKQSICNGDSGGPLIEAKSRNLIGISSFGSAFGCEIGLPQGFTRVSAFLPWIKEVTGVECKK